MSDAGPTTAQEMLDAALAHHGRGERAEAEALYGRILDQDPRHADALHLLGVLALERGDSETAVRLIDEAIEINSSAAIFHGNLGLARHRAGDAEGAAAALRRAINLNPAYTEAYDNLGNALQALGRRDEAIASYQAALRIRADSPATWFNLAVALRDSGRLNEAIAAYRSAIRARDNFPEAHAGLAAALREAGRIDEAIAAHETAIGLRPDRAESIADLGNTLKDAGRLDEAITRFREALALKPQSHTIHSGLVYALHFQPGAETRGLIKQEQEEWVRRHVYPLAQEVHRHENDRSPDRRLRVGYVSPDFRDHVIGRNVLPLIRNHDGDQFEIICYSDAGQSDRITDQFKTLANAWRDTGGLRDEAVADAVCQDHIDILVDLTQHLAGNRLRVFAMKPAPVQVSFAGYPAGTGLPTIDCRISDPFLDPPERADAGERIIRLARSFWCYDPLGDDAEVNELPARRMGRVTFGCLNNFCKINYDVLSLWAGVLRKVPASRLLVLSGEGAHRDATAAVLREHGVSPDRIEFLSPRSRRLYLDLYHRIDVALDTFPYNGHTTSLDALWMGVPVVTLAGDSSLGRAGVSQLSNVGLAEFIAVTPDGFVEIAAEWAGSIERLAGLRKSLRPRMEKSPLMDAKKFAGDIEGAYRRVWRSYCTSAT